MDGYRKWVEIWLAENHRQMISCPYQPGNLVISRAACFRRYRIGRKKRELRKAESRFGYSLCGRCPIGGKFEQEAGTANPATEKFLAGRGK